MELREALHYDFESGLLTSKIQRGRLLPGQEVGYLTSEGYVGLCVNYKKYYAHRVAWFLFYGEWPSKFIDHVDGDRTNNRISNLREATPELNAENKPKAKGCYWNEDRQKWESYIKVSGTTIPLGRYSFYEDAREAYIKAKRHYHKGFVDNEKSV